MSRFVLLRHEFPPGSDRSDHWDFMLEHEGVLRTWELGELPSSWARALGIESPNNLSEVCARPLADHRLAYLDFEGPLTGDRGTVRRCDRGEFDVLCSDATRFHVNMSGSYLRGEIELRLMESQWRLRLLGSFF